MKGIIGLIILLLGVIGFIALAIALGKLGLYLILLVLTPFGISLIISALSPDEKNFEEQNKSYRAKNNVADNATSVLYYSGIMQFDSNIESLPAKSLAKSQAYYFWRKNQNINILSKPDNKGQIYVKNKISLDVNKINYYTLQGDKYAFTNIKGGGSSLGKAVVGGAIAGGAGAVIASRNKIESTTAVVDDRRTMIYYEDNHQKSIIVLSSFAYEYLLSVLPEKEYNFVMSQKESANSNISELEQLASLRDKGILTEEEFNIKKKQLLGI